MKLKFMGATGGVVTGSCYHLSGVSGNFLVDCGMFQGKKEIEARNWEPWPFNPSKLEYVFLTHAHLDHVGLLPRLVKEGFRGKIIATAATRDLTKIILDDAAHIQAENEKHGRLPENKTVLYRDEDVQQLMTMFQVYEMCETITLKDNLRFRMRGAGHILGSVSYEIWFSTTTGRERKIVFSGDLGQSGARIIKDPDYIREADYIVMESTYGGRLHKDKSATLIEMLAIMQKIKQENSQGIIPTFAVERTQEILYEINLFVENKILNNMRVFLDSPLAIKATEIFRRHKDLYDTDARDLLKKGDDPFEFPGFEYTQSVDASKSIAAKRGSLVMAGSGMCTGGRVLHHLIRELPNPQSRVIFVGFQVPGTLGRRLIDGATEVRIWGHDVPVKAQMHTLGGFSAHGDQRDLLYWLNGFGHHPRQVFITHGDNENRQVLKNKVHSELRLNVELPDWRDEVTLD